MDSGNVGLILVVFLRLAILTADYLEGPLEGAFLRSDFLVVVFLLGLNLVVQGLLLLVDFVHFACHLNNGVDVVLSPRFFSLDRTLEEFHPCIPAFLPHLKLVLLIVFLKLGLSLMFGLLDFSDVFLGNLNLLNTLAVSAKV
jgi:hypothetical protein